MGGKGSGRKPASKAPPGLAISPEDLKARAAAARKTPQERDSKGRFGSGAPPGAGPIPEDLGPQTFEFPVESLTLVHSELWALIAKSLRSTYKVSPKFAGEMGELSAIVLKQYLGPALAQHAPLGAYVFTQLTALVAVLATRGPKPAPKPAESESGPSGIQPKPTAGVYTEPAIVGSITRPVDRPSQYPNLS